MTRPKNIALTVFTVAVVVLTAVWLSILVLRPSFVPPVLPVPNAYDDLLRAAEMLAPRTGFHDEEAPEELATRVEQNRLALKLARDALAKECTVTQDWASDPSAGGDPSVLVRVQAMRALARAFGEEMQEDLSLQRSKTAVSSGLATFQLGNECYRGGLMVDYLVGLAVQYVAIDELRRVVAQDPTARVEILQGLVPLLDTGEPAENVIQRELDYIRSAARGITGWIARFQSQQLLAPAVQAARQADLRRTAQQRLFVILLALHVYQDEHGTFPATLANLSPEFLTNVPLDPFSETQFVYRVENDTYRLYSVGINHRDDGGEGDETGLGLDMLYDLTTDDEEQ